MRRALAMAAAVAAVLVVAAPAQGRGEARLLAKVPLPGFPASAYPHPNGNIYVGTYTNPGGDHLRSRVLEYDTDGTVNRSWTVPDQDLNAEHGIQAATSDGRGRLVLLDRTPARALLLNRTTGEFSRYSTFADLPACPGAAVQSGCSPSTQDLKPMANYAAWGPDGSLYVTDFQQAVLWRVPPGGGNAEVWLADRRLDGQSFGTTGIALAGDRRTLLVVQGSSGGGGGGNPTTGKLYSLPIQPDGKPGELRQMWESGPAELPDGFGIGRSGRIYIALANANQIAVVGPDGAELERFNSDQFDTPSSAKFFGTSLAVPNQSFATGNRDRQTLMAVEAGEQGLPELIPAAKDEDGPYITELSLLRTRVRVSKRGRVGIAQRRRRRAPRGTRIRLRLNERATLFIQIQRRRGRRWKHVRRFTRRGKVGRNQIRFSGRVRLRKRGRSRVRALKRGRYRFSLYARDAAGNKSERERLEFRVVR